MTTQNIEKYVEDYTPEAEACFSANVHELTQKVINEETAVARILAHHNSSLRRTLTKVAEEARKEEKEYLIEIIKNMKIEEKGSMTITYVNGTKSEMPIHSDRHLLYNQALTDILAYLENKN